MSGKKWLDGLKAVFTSRRLIIGLGALAIILLIWFGGPLVAIAGWTPLGSVSARLLFLTLLALIIIGWQFWRLKKERQANEKVVNEMLSSDTNDALLQEEVDTLRDTMKDALALVKKWRPGRFSSVYALPWYMIIGAPGSGKSTALLNSGMEFPLKDEMGIDAVKGVGGTRHCDWWFTNKAVIIDTAGRYTTQDSADKRDAKGWNSFLGLLKKHRPRRPINGVMLAISIPDLLEQTPTERSLHARAIKQRVQELRNRLGLIFPVYVMLTKFDLLEGFSETFGMLSEQEREEVFGMTFPLQSVRDAKTLPNVYEQEFEAMQTRLSEFLLHRVQQERTATTQRKIYQFPKQVALLQAPLWDMLKEIFYPSAYEDVPLLRGIYMVSSEQGGQPMDKVSRLVEHQFNITAHKPAPHLATQDSFFLHQLFENIIFSEHNLAAADIKHEKRFIWVRRTAVSAAVVGSLALCVGWYLSYDWNRDLLNQYEQQLADLQSDLNKKDLDWVQLNRVLTGLSSMPGVNDHPMPASAGPQQLGLFQGDRFGEAAEHAYHRVLRTVFADHLKQALEADVDENLGNLEYLYETFKTYLMLGDRSHLDRDQVIAWYQLMLEKALPGSINNETRAQLSLHLDNYLDHSGSISLDKPIIDRARAQLTTLPLAERAYQRIKLDSAASHLPSFRLPMVLGSVAEKVFERRSGQSLQKGIPGLYTQNGFQGVFLPEKDKIISRLIDDSWVYGEDDADFQDLDEEAIQVQVADRYFRDYIYVWTNYLKDLRIKSFATASEGARIGRLLSGPDAPLSRLLAALKKNTHLELPKPDKKVDAAKKAAEVASRRLSSRKQELAGLAMGSSEGQGAADEPPVNQAFAQLNSVPKETIQALRADAKIVSRYFEQQSAMGQSNVMATVDSKQFNQALRDFYTSLRDSESDLLGAMVGDYLGDARQVLKVTEAKQINDIWRGSVYRDYRRAIAGRYPFRKAARSEVALQDFGEFFGYGGTLDKFFNDHLAAYVDTSHSPWKLTKNIGIKESSLRIFEKAQHIREAFFEPGSRVPQFSFSLKPRSLDSTVSQFMLEMDGQNMTYRHGPTRMSKFEWPENTQEQMTRIVFIPLKDETPAAVSFQGPWAMFHILQQAGSIHNEHQHQIIELTVQDYHAQLELVTSSVNNPFSTQLFTHFLLPRTL